MNGSGLRSHARTELVRLVLSPSELVAARASQSGLIRYPLPGTGDLGPWVQTVRACLKELGNVAGRSRCRLRVLVLPPLVEAKTERLPMLSSMERRAVLSRDAQKYFAMSGHAVVADAIPSVPPADGRALRLHVLLAVPEHIVSMLAESAEDAGFAFESVTASVICLAAATAARSRSERASVIVCRYDDRLELAAITDGTITAIRRLPLECEDDVLSDAVSSLSSELGPEGQRREVLVIGDGETSLIPITGDDCGRAHSLRTGLSLCDPAAVCLAQRTFGPPVDLLPPALSARRSRTRWKRAGLNLAAGLTALTMAFGYRLYSVGHALRRERVRRVELSAHVSEALRIQANLSVLQREWTLIREGDSKLWDRTRTLKSIAEATPLEAVLQSIKLRGDTLLITGGAESAAGVLLAFQQLPDFSESRFPAPIEQVVESNDGVIERFVIRSTLSTPRRVRGNEPRSQPRPSGH